MFRANMDHSLQSTQAAMHHRCMAKGLLGFWRESTHFAMHHTCMAKGLFGFWREVQLHLYLSRRITQHVIRPGSPLIRSGTSKTINKKATSEI